MAGPAVTNGRIMAAAMMSKTIHLVLRFIKIPPINKVLCPMGIEQFKIIPNENTLQKTGQLHDPGDHLRKNKTKAAHFPVFLTT
jgi:hypothetical protein